MRGWCDYTSGVRTPQLAKPGSHMFSVAGVPRHKRSDPRPPRKLLDQIICAPPELLRQISMRRHRERGRERVCGREAIACALRHAERDDAIDIARQLRERARLRRL